MEARDVIELLDRLDQAGVLSWVDGGWGVDALLGEQTRPHSDLDLVVVRPGLEVVQDVLWALRFEVLRDWLPNAIAYVDLEGRQVDLHPVDPTAGGGAQVRRSTRRRQGGRDHPGRKGYQRLSGQSVAAFDNLLCDPTCTMPR